MRPQIFSSASVALFAASDRSELDRRPSRAPNFEAENRGLVELARAFSTSREMILQRLADVVLDVCKAHSAGVSLIEHERGQPVLRWKAIAGELKGTVDTSLPRTCNPGGTPANIETAQLMSRPARHFYSAPVRSDIEEVLLVPLRLSGTLLGCVWVVAHDGTRRFDAEDARLIGNLSKFAAAPCEMLKSFELLETKIVASDRAGEAAVAADTHKDQFVAILGHELRGYLGPVSIGVELLKLGTFDMAGRHAICAKMSGQIGTMARLVDDLLDVARVRGGNLQLRRTRVEISKVIECAVEGGRDRIAGRNHTLIVEPATEPLFIDADVPWLSRALRNLLDNGAKYTNPNGLIVVSTERHADEIVISVKDNGIGIARDELETIFALYSQCGQAGTERSAGGLGLGLYLARLLIEGHGGTVGAFSAGLGSGSELVVRLPCSSASA